MKIEVISWQILLRGAWVIVRHRNFEAGRLATNRAGHRRQQFHINRFL